MEVPSSTQIQERMVAALIETSSAVGNEDTKYTAHERVMVVHKLFSQA